MTESTPPTDETAEQGDEHGVWSEDMELAPAHPGDREAPEPAAGEGERLQKVLARAGVGSRRVCEDMIDEAGSRSTARSCGCRACASTRPPR